MPLGAGDIIRTAVNFLLPSGDQYQNVFHHIFDGVGGVADSVVVADIAAYMAAQYAELNAYVLDTTVVQLSFVDQVEFVVDKWEVVANLGTFSMGWAPTGVAQQIPNTVSAFVTFKTARPKSVGRKFLFPPMETQQDAGIMTGPYVTAVVAWADDALNDIEVDILNTLHAGIPRTGVDDWLNFTVAVVTNLLGTQRRRRQGSGA